MKFLYKKVWIFNKFSFNSELSFNSLPAFYTDFFIMSSCWRIKALLFLQRNFSAKAFGRIRSIITNDFSKYSNIIFQFSSEFLSIKTKPIKNQLNSNSPLGSSSNSSSIWVTWKLLANSWFVRLTAPDGTTNGEKFQLYSSLFSFGVELSD